MILPEQQVKALKKLLDNGPKKILILAHTNPDGDAIGSSLAWRAYLAQLGHKTRCIMPNRYPYFLEWMNDIAHVSIFKEDTDGEMARFIGEADIIFCLDFNQIDRLEGLSEAVETNSNARKILIDHHLYPPADEYDLQFSDPKACSTSYIVYRLIVELAGTTDVIDYSMAEALYVGIMTDTGNFSFSNLTSNLFRAVAVLIEKGISIPLIHNAVYNNFSEGRMRLLGYVLNEKMVVTYEYGAAYVTLTEEEMRRFNFKQGDSEGFVNFALAIRGIMMSAMFVESRQHIRVSLRSRGKADVNVFARRYFNGGGHRNAAGGKSFVSMEETIERFKEALKEYFGE